MAGMCEGVFVDTLSECMMTGKSPCMMYGEDENSQEA
jgi:hypothetical protein